MPVFSGKPFDVHEMVPEANFDLLTRSAKGSILPVSAGFFCVNEVISSFFQNYGETVMISTSNDLPGNHSFFRSPLKCPLGAFIWTISIRIKY